MAQIILNVASFIVIVIIVYSVFLLYLSLLLACYVYYVSKKFCRAHFIFQLENIQKKFLFAKNKSNDAVFRKHHHVEADLYIICRIFWPKKFPSTMKKFIPIEPELSNPPFSPLPFSRPPFPEAHSTHTGPKERRRRAAPHTPPEGKPPPRHRIAQGRLVIPVRLTASPLCGGRDE